MRFSGRRALCALIALLSIILPKNTEISRADTNGAPSFTQTDLDPAAGKKYVDFTGINDAGEVVGMSRPDGAGGVPTSWKPDGGAGVALDTDLGTASGINKIGVIVGHAGTDAVAWRDGTKKVLKMPSTVTYASASGINNNGEIVGEAIRKDVSTAFLRLTDASLVFLPSLPGLPGSRAYAIDDAGTVVGTAFNDAGATKGCLWVDRKPVPLPTLGGANSEARAINSRGDAVGDADLPSGKTHACLWHGGKAVDLGTLPGDDSSRALYINDQDEIVGVSGFKTAFLWKDGQMYKLQDLMDPRPDWVPAQATVVNNKGQIAGWGINDDGRVFAFLLTPK